MSEHKGAITLIIATLVLFSLFVIFGTEVIGPMLSNIGNKFNDMVDGVFTGVTDPPDGELPPAPTE